MKSNLLDSKKSLSFHPSILGDKLSPFR